MAGPPVGLLGVVAAVAAVGAAVGAFGWGSWLATVGWALAGPVAIGLVGLYTATDTARQTAPVYLRPGWLRALYAVVVLLIVVGVTVGALGIAFWIGRR